MIGNQLESAALTAQNGGVEAASNEFLGGDFGNGMTTLSNHSWSMKIGMYHQLKVVQNHLFVWNDLFATCSNLQIKSPSFARGWS